MPDVFPSAADMRYEAALAHYEATIADLRERVRIMAPMVCEGCGCALGKTVGERGYECEDCRWCDYELSLNPPARVAACISVGLRTLCGRRLLDGGEVK